MNINVLSKYIILFLFAVLVVLSVLLVVYSAENKALQKANIVLKEQVLLREAAIKEIDKNIQSLQRQVIEAEQICDERLKARNDVLLLLKNKHSPSIIQPAASLNKERVKNWVGNSEAVPHPNRPLLQGQVPQKCDSASLELGLNQGGILDYEKNNFAVDSINKYWGMFLTHAGGS